MSKKPTDQERYQDGMAWSANWLRDQGHWELANRLVLAYADKFPVDAAMKARIKK